MPTRTLLKPEKWPAEHRAALAVFVDLHPEESPWALPSPHADESAAEHLLEMLADLDVTPTLVVDPIANNQLRVPSNTNRDTAAHVFEASADLSEVLAGGESMLGEPPRGIVMLSGLSIPSTDDQVLWFMDGSGAPFPEAIDEGKVVIPYSPYWHDATWLAATNPSPPSVFLEHVSLSLASVRTRGELMTLFLTAQIAGLPGHLESVQRFLDEAIAAGDVWITNGSGIASHVAESVDSR